VLLYPERGLVLNPSAAAIVRRLDGTRSIAEIGAELAGASGADPDEVTRDVEEICRDLRSRALVEEV
jgi:coenzyme PQQ biosynthesis protein PqqD